MTEAVFLGLGALGLAGVPAFIALAIAFALMNENAPSTGGRRWLWMAVCMVACAPVSAALGVFFLNLPGASS